MPAEIHVESEYRDGDECAIVIMACGVVGFISNDATTTPPDLDFVDVKWAHMATCAGCLGREDVPTNNRPRMEIA